MSISNMPSERQPVPSFSECSDSDATQSSNASSYQTAQAVVNKLIPKLTSKNKIFPYIKEHLQPFYRHDSKNVLEIFKSMMNQLDIILKEEIDMLFDNSNLQQLLTELDTIKQEGNTSKTWRPSGNPEKDIEAHLQESSEKELEHMEKVHAALVSKNKWLNECVQRMSLRNSSAMKAIDDTWQEWEEAASAVTEDAREEIINITNNFSEVNFLEEEC